MTAAWKIIPIEACSEGVFNRTVARQREMTVFRRAYDDDDALLPYWRKFHHCVFFPNVASYRRCFDETNDDDIDDVVSTLSVDFYMLLPDASSDWWSVLPVSISCWWKALPGDCRRYSPCCLFDVLPRHGIDQAWRRQTVLMTVVTIVDDIPGEVCLAFYYRAAWWWWSPIYQTPLCSRYDDIPRCLFLRRTTFWRYLPDAAEVFCLRVMRRLDTWWWWWWLCRTWWPFARSGAFYLMISSTYSDKAHGRVIPPWHSIGDDDDVYYYRIIHLLLMSPKRHDIERLSRGVAGNVAIDDQMMVILRGSDDGEVFQWYSWWPLMMAEGK